MTEPLPPDPLPGLARPGAGTADPAVSYDVAVLGSHLAGAVLAAAVARQGYRVLLLDAVEGEDHGPWGETTVPYTAEVFLLIADRFELPEFAAFGAFADLPPEIRRASGVKRSLAFFYHRAGLPQHPEEVVQFNVPGEHSEWHLYRPAVDEYARSLALRYGAEVPAGRPRVSQAEETADHMTLVMSDGSLYTCRYLADAAGIHSPLTGLTRPVTGPADGPDVQSRVLHAHLGGVSRYADGHAGGTHRRATSWSDGTVHHIFDGGWIQVADFANHAEGANRRASVTVSLDPRRHADLPADPEAAFRTLVARYPGIARQFEEAVTLTPWSGGHSWRHRAALTHGDRWVAFGRSAARTDDMLSSDVTAVMEVTHALAAALLNTLAGGSAAREFGRVASFQADLIRYNDRWRSAARAACVSFQLWNAFSRVWLLWQILADLSLKRARNDAAAHGGWAPVEQFELGGLWFRVPAGLRGFLEEFFTLMDAAGSGRQPPDEVADQIFRRLRQARFVPPLYRFGDPAARYYNFTFGRRLLMLAWIKTVAPADFRRLLTRDNVTARRESPIPAVRTTVRRDATSPPQAGETTDAIRGET